jgi:hypothetical protein
MAMPRKTYGALGGAALLAAGLAVARAATWVPIEGNVRLANGTPVCAMVLANGQYMFSCDSNGTYSLNVPLDDNGEITLFAFADGFAPFSTTLVPSVFPFSVYMQTAAPNSPLIAMTHAVACAGSPNWVHLTGTIESYDSQPLCAMVLSNGQQMFSCDASLGQYDLTVPVDENGNVTLFGFADGFQPYRETFVAPQCAAAGFDGYYVGTATATTAYDQFGDPCSSATFQFTIANSQIQGSGRDALGDEFDIEGTVSPVGDISFGVAAGQEILSNFSGTIIESTPSGTWADAGGCRGTWSGTKQ